ncbi:MAG: flagellar hook protein FlgE [Deltaproteobacteria bacterium]|nr:flagellar hook protein FlgE [Deltaproteobacteria bacterium]
MINGISAARSALKAFERKLGASANNIANIRTQGFKKSHSSFQELSPQNVSTSSGVSQVGRGTTIGQITEEFSQGSFESTSSPTDMAIGGDGFFMVRALEGGNYYTRDGQFQFDKDGRFLTTSGCVVQGWELDPITGEIQGAIQDITLSSFTSPPEETTIIRNIVNLNAHAEDNSVGINALAGAWDGDNPNQEHIADNAYSYQTSTKLYDGVGASHDITVYFDKRGTGSVWEYIVTAHPAEDRRSGATGDNLGLLARGTLVFNDSGAISDVTMDINDGTGNWTPQNATTDLTDSHFTFHPDFLGATDGSTEMSIQLDFGSFYNGSSWVSDSPSSTQYSSASNTIYSSANGYGSGDLESITVGTDGVITGRYSNGQALNLFQVALAKFNNPQGLKKMGSNLYAMTAESGDAITGQPGTNGLGSIGPNALEQSNVDPGEEFVNIILTKIGFQANLKVISAEDEMVGNLLNIIS